MNRRQEREEAFLMLFEGEFDSARSAEEIYELAKEGREVEESAYIRTVLVGAIEKREELNALIAKYSRGWQRERITPVAAAVMLLAVYEMLYMKDVPTRVSINEAVELIKKYDEDKARVFVNGVLNSVSRDEAVLCARENA
jgi:N utilization substance protein B